MATNKRKLGTTRKSEEKGLQPSRKAKATAAVTTAASKKRKAEEEAAARDKKDGDKGDAVAPAPHVGGGKRKRKSAVEAPAIKAPAVEAPAVEAPTAAAHAHEPATGKRATAAKRRRLAKEFHVALAAGDVFTFGSNPFGALGLGEDITEKQRAAHVDLGGAKAVQVACGGMHTAVLLEDGSVITFGVNDEGALGRWASLGGWRCAIRGPMRQTRGQSCRCPAHDPNLESAGGGNGTWQA
jgi:regulator of chromosome condensation